jgi:hypothetical protein
MHVNLNWFFQENINQLIILYFKYILTSPQTQSERFWKLKFKNRKIDAGGENWQNVAGWDKRLTSGKPATTASDSWWWKPINNLGLKKCRPEPIKIWKSFLFYMV